MKRIGKVAKGQKKRKEKQTKKMKRNSVLLCSKTFMLIELEIKRS